MKLFRNRLASNYIDVETLAELGLPPSRYGSWRLDDAQRDRLYDLLGVPSEHRAGEPISSPVAPPSASPGSPAPLRQHQEDGLAFFRERGGVVAFWHGIGTGKTRLAIECLRDARKLTRAVIVCPLTVSYTWQRELEQWAGTQGELVTGTLAQRLAALRRPGPWIINYEGLRLTREVGFRMKKGREIPKIEWPVVDAILEREPGALVLDESTRIKTRTAQVSRVVHRALRPIETRILLSGEPAPNGPQDLWSQLYMVEDTPLGYRTPAGLRNAYCIMGGYMGKQVLGHRDLDELHHRMSRVAHIVRTEDCVDLPEKQYVTHEIDLTPKERRAYDSMKKECWARLSQEETLTADTVLTQVLRLQQLTGGLAGTKGAGAKVKAALDLVSDAPHPVIIWCRFVNEIETLAREFERRYKGRCRTIYGETSQRERHATLEAFDAGEVDVLIGQPRAGGIGLNLQRACWSLFFSNGFSLEDRDQAEGRVYRQGQTRGVTLVDLVARNTVDSHVLKALKAKRSVAEVIMTGSAEKWFD